MSKTKTLHFTLGPVQSFVEQARRTRDLWAGSFLLSYLSGQAMKAVIDAGGEIVFPAVQAKNSEFQDELLKAIMSKPHNNPRVGSLPNRFKADVTNAEDFEPEQCRIAVRNKWQEIAKAVWDEYIKDVANEQTEAVWNRQIETFWDMAWVMGDSDDPGEDGTWLDRRKNWRSHTVPEEGGDHCTLMGDWQELSGFVRPRHRKEQVAFWKVLSTRLGALELGEYERLSAVALIKRLYPKVAEKAIGWKLDVENWPSTPYMAAVPWLREAHQTDEAKAYLQAIEAAQLEWAFGKYNADLTCLKNAGRFAKLDGNFFHQAALENKNATPLKPELSEPEDEALRRELVAELCKVNKAVGHPASTFYALLLMDGDSLGKLLQHKDVDETEVSEALSSFTNRVDGIVQKHCGKTVYAGGDDVMALLPLDKALQAANELRGAYLGVFKGVPLPDGLQATISGAIVFARYNLSLRAVLKEAHHQLDEVAKAQNGRDSLAVAVCTGSGRTVQWVSTWQDTDSKHLTEQLEQLKGHFADEQFSSKFFYNIRERFEILLGDKEQLTEGLSVLKLLTAEYQKSRERTVAQEEAEKTVGKLVHVCRKRIREKTGEKTRIVEDERSLNVNGALLVRFLAGKGRGIER